MTYVDAASAPVKNTGMIKLFSPNDFDGMRKACQLTATCLDELSIQIKPGITTQQIDNFVFGFGRDHGAIPATLNYRGYTRSCCTSINHVVCHGIPDDRQLRDGDIVNIDVTYILNGWHGDSSRMYTVGNVKRAARRLIEVVYKSMILGIEAAKPANSLGDIGHAIQTYAESQRCSVVRDFCGHGINKLFHDAPNVLHYGSPGKGIKLRQGMIFTIEPMINLGKPDVKILKDGWTAVTRDHSLSAQFEHTIGVTQDSFEIFTLSPCGHTIPPYM